MARRRSLRRTSVTTVSKPAVKIAPPSLQTTLLFFGIALYLGTTVFRLCIQECNLLKQAQILETERTGVLTYKKELTAQIASCRTNAGIERMAREQLGLVMGSEIPVKTAAAPMPTLAIAELAGRAGAVGESRPARANVGLPPAMAALVKFFTPLWQ